MVLLARVTGVNNIMEYCDKLIESRMDDGLHLLPPLIDPERLNYEKHNLNLPHLMIDKVSIYICVVNHS